jgi:hypothetical protein
MHLVYIDESGNTGVNLHDSDQPLFVLAALIVPETCWQTLENQVEGALAELFPDLATAGAEIHATDLRGGRGQFKGVSVKDRIAIRDRWLNIAKQQDLKLGYRAIEKRRFHQWQVSTFGDGVFINPHVAAFPLVARVVDEYLAALSPQALGIFISDENKEIVNDVEKSIRLLRGIDGRLRLNQIVEKGFFIDSTKSRILQLCDICALSLRKMEERKIGQPAKSFDDEGIRLVVPLIHRGNEALTDVLKWLAEGRKDTQK